jgi:hypothetical protein
MASELGYDVSVKRSISASVAVFSLFGLVAFLGSIAHSQINGAPASVTSPGFGGHAINGPRAGVTSLGPNGYAPGRVQFSGANNGEDRHQHHHFVPYVPPFGYAIPVPYAVDIGETEEEADPVQPDGNDQGGPTVFDRRGAGERSYMPPPRDVPPAHSAEPTNDTSVAADPLEPTLLVFKDGHKLEVENYAIIGQTLFDMTPGHARKVPLKDLDLEATRRENDEHGVAFQLPLSSQAN